jgi:hypothetical protein
MHVARAAPALQEWNRRCCIVARMPSGVRRALARSKLGRPISTPCSMSKPAFASPVSDKSRVARGATAQPPSCQRRLASNWNAPAEPSGLQFARPRPSRHARVTETHQVEFSQSLGSCPGAMPRQATTCQKRTFNSRVHLERMQLAK